MSNILDQKKVDGEAVNKALALDLKRVCCNYALIVIIVVLLFNWCYKVALVAKFGHSANGFLFVA